MELKELSEMGVHPVTAKIRGRLLPKLHIDRAGKRFALALIAVTVLGGAMRAACCFWGYPYQLHTDENIVVYNTFDMLWRRSWIVNVYDRPDQFEIKCLSILFDVFSWLRYHMAAYRTFDLHHPAYFTVSRLYTAAFGTAMIPLASFLTGSALRQSMKEREDRRMAQILAAGLIAFSPVLVENSAYVTPDIPLAFTVLLAAYLSMRYVRSGNMKTLCAIACVTGASITIKYPGAILCFMIAFIVIYRAVIEKRYRQIVIRGLFSIAVILVAIFVIAPNLITCYQDVIDALIRESRSNHLGADGLGFFGNMLYYLESAVKSTGALSTVFMLAGAAFLLLHKSVDHAFVLPGLFFWICMSVLSLHWLRWGMPMYPFYLILTAIGGMGFVRGIRRGKAKLPAGVRRAAIGAASACLALVIVNGVVSSAAVVKQQLTKDTRIAALEYCSEHGITAENSVYEGYTPFNFYSGGMIAGMASVDEDGLHFNQEEANKEYLVFSNSYRGRYMNEPQEYAEQVAVYRYVEEHLPLVCSWQAKLRSDNAWEIPNILSNIRYIMKRGTLSGSDFWIYRLHPEDQP